MGIIQQQKFVVPFESLVFYDLFKLQLYPCTHNQLAMGIQLMALPINRPNKEQGVGLNTKCIMSETRTRIKKKFDAEFDYSFRSSQQLVAVMEAVKVLDIDDRVDGLHFRVEIVVMG